MKAVSKIFTGAAAAALVTTGFAAAPAQAQYRHDRGGIDTGDIITGVAILGGIAAIASALGRDDDRYDRRYDRGYRQRGYTAAVEACGYEAQRIGRGQVRITDVDRTGNNRYRVRGVVEAGYDRYDRGYDRRYGRYDRRDRYDRYDRRGRDDFTCYARANGRITDFRI